MALPKLNQTLDFGKLLSNDKQLQGQLAGLKAQGSGFSSDLNAARQQAMIRYGGVPSDFGPLSGSVSIDPLTRQLAEQSTASGFSTLGQLQHQYQLAQSASVGSLGERGIVRSGAYGQHATENLRNYNLATSQAQDTLNQTLNQLWSNFQTNQQGLTDQGIDATNEALKRLIEMINAGQLVNQTTTPKTHAAPIPQFQYVPGRGRALL